MGTPAKYLPKHIPLDTIDELLVSIGLPKAARIVPAKVTAEYHSIYMVSLPSNDITTHKELVLRVAGHHLPRIKTANEVGVMSWIAKNTKIPIADLVAYDDSRDNPIAHEYTLLARVTGETLSNIYSTLDAEQVDGILDQLADIVVELHGHSWNQIGGLNLDAQGEVQSARIVDETFWTVPDLGLWPADETVDSLNIAGPYENYVDYVSAQIRQYIRLIRIHDKLAFMRDDIPRLEAFVAALPSRSAELNNTKLILAHKDLHFSNVLYDKISGRITAILDWEFSGVVPAQRWDPVRAFLWTGEAGEAGMAEKRRLWELFTSLCEKRNTSFFPQQVAFVSPRQEAMQNVVNYVRAIVEVSPRDQRKELVAGWRATALDNIAHVGA
ncbi:phosphotransferase enzyme family-domain-containing protein [Hypoxylon trugodes]|uniref:phosphotransferase enzyme family-domain-containing protein n=1 Tax=Hypoxylon trugodes TaxID=326681 RepID=UPI0021954E60|nr:phosphotransferase enzyme family-domain-containing protein [Hypoxylon trugodes]KAI1390356.1 phosphotransferase enzyme family-domain-containing protein [Hypoxylon trugodes]